MDSELHEIGSRLLRHADEEAEFSARGVISELFPYIYQASRRMSTRAISRWLADGANVKLSAVSIAKALRNPEKYWREFAEFIEPEARIVQDALDWPMEKFLFNAEGFRHETESEKTSPRLSGDSDEELARSWDEFRSAVQFLNDKWFSLETAVRDNCWKYFQVKEGEEENAK